MSIDDLIVWPADGLVPVVIQEATSRDVLMIGFMNREALNKTRDTGYVHFWSRSRQHLWKKGVTSGHVQRVASISINCEQNALLIEVEQTNAVCHDGYATCFYRRIDEDGRLVITSDRSFDPDDVYGNDGLATLSHTWWGAYEWLKTNDLETESSSSRLLRSGASVITRIGDELLELAGVLDGTHGHGELRDDVILEGSQVLYWVVIELIVNGHRWDDVRPDRSLDVTSAMPVGTLISLLRALATAIDEPLDIPTAREVMRLVASAARAIEIEPIELLRYDLEALKSRSHLDPYFRT